MRTLVLLGLATALSPTAFAATLDETRARLAEIERKIDGAAERETALLAALDEIGREVAGRAEEIESIRAEMEQARARSEEDRRTIARLSARSASKKGWLADRLRATYIRGRPGYLKVLFASASYADLVRRSKRMRIVARRDAALLAELTRDLAEVTRRQADYDRDVALLAELEREVRTKSEKLSIERALRAKLLAQVKGERAGFEKVRDQLQAAEAALTARIVRSASSRPPPPPVSRPFAEAKGRLGSPVRGAAVKLGFGPYRHPKLGLPMLHQGISYATPIGSEVRSLYDGRVEMARWFASFGQVLVIDHGDGWRSLYAHLARMLKKEGEAVREGDLIATSGDTGSLEGPRLYFAIFREGKPVDPAEWLAP